MADSANEKLQGAIVALAVATVIGPPPVTVEQFEPPHSNLSTVEGFTRGRSGVLQSPLVNVENLFCQLRNLRRVVMPHGKIVSTNDMNIHLGYNSFPSPCGIN